MHNVRLESFIWDKMKTAAQETVKDREAWHAADHRVAKSWTQFSDLTIATTAIIHAAISQ